MADATANSKVIDYNTIVEILTQIKEREDPREQILQKSHLFDQEDKDKLAL